ncbi:MAG: WD40 repeat domain-containing protein [Sulfuricurvum sp.]|uniref:WD40 repeat domain-containing protein n=1 Tax=Sulfuricurvum sp. TaxID=2025608 RepID=UPI00262FE433|nr:WD40 repeat domain-containing protein [Sulfuricurvum sp.]MDD5159847.1 WD40 repeat domain-containing protein [Sulfuricurvum sp.]
MKHIILLILLTIGVWAQDNDCKYFGNTGYILSPKSQSITLFDGCKTFVNFSDKGAKTIVAPSKVDNFSPITATINASNVIVTSKKQGYINSLNIENGESKLIVDLNLSTYDFLDTTPYVNADGNRLLLKYYRDNKGDYIALYNLINGEIIFFEGNADQIYMNQRISVFAYSRFITEFKSNIFIYDDKSEVGVIDADSGLVYPVLSPNGKILINKVFDFSTRKFHLDAWDIATNQKLYRIDIGEAYVFGEDFINNRQTHTNEMLLRLAKKIGIYEISTGKLIRELPELSKQNIFGIAYLNENTVITNDMRIWDIKNDKELLKLYIFENGEWVIVTPDGSFDSSDNGLKIFNQRLQDGKEQSRTLNLYDPKIVQQTLKSIMKWENN